MGTGWWPEGWPGSQEVDSEAQCLAHLKNTVGPWLTGSGSWSVSPIHQGCAFEPQSGHTQEAANECMKEWNNKVMFLSLSLSLPSPAKISNLKKKKGK